MEYELMKNYVLNKIENEISTNYCYHNILHTNLVMKNAVFLGASEGLTEEENILLLSAAVLHDSGYLVSSNEHEEQSCVFAKNILPNYNYNPSQIQAICNMIMATKMPQSPQNLCEKVLCDADLLYLGTDDYSFYADLLYKEMSQTGNAISILEWIPFQINFMNIHRFHTASANRLFNEKKKAVLETLKNSNTPI